MPGRRFAAVALFAGLAGEASGQEAGDAVRGLAFAKKNCAACHAVDPNEPAPTIDGAPPFKHVANTPGMTATALLVVLRTPHRNMPDFIISQADTDDVTSYIMSLKNAD